MKTKILLLIFTLLINNVLSAANNGGNYGAGIKNEGHTEYFATGKIYTENPVSAVYSNPAGIIETEKMLVSATTTKLFTEIDGIKQTGLDFLMLIVGYNFGLSYLILKIEDICEVDNVGLIGNFFNLKIEIIRILVVKKLIDNLFIGV